MYSAMVEREECAALLLSHGALISAQDDSGQTALHWAALTVSVIVWEEEGAATVTSGGSVPYREATSVSSCC